MKLIYEKSNPPVFEKNSLSWYSSTVNSILTYETRLSQTSDYRSALLVLSAIFLLHACTTVPIPRNTSVAVGGFWEQDENTDPRFYNSAIAVNDKMGVLYAAGKNVMVNNVRANGLVKIGNNTHISTGSQSSARIEFKPTDTACLIQIQEFTVGRGYGDTANCQHHIETSHADAQTDHSIYHFDVAQQQTQVTVLSGSVRLALQSNPGQFVDVNRGQEAIVASNSIIGPKPVPLDEIKRRVQWRDNYIFSSREVDWATVGKVAVGVIAVGTGVGLSTGFDDNNPPPSQPPDTPPTLPSQPSTSPPAGNVPRQNTTLYPRFGNVITPAPTCGTPTTGPCVR